jgi:septal ring factor EnvC (AmiA/AmiB activator)
MAIEQTSVIPILTACATVFFGITAIVWNIFSKASATRQDDLKVIHSKIEAAVSQCINKQRDLQMQIDQTKAMLVDHKVEAISRQDANNLFEEKIRPVRESIDKVERGLEKMEDKFDIMLKALSRIEGCLEAQKRRRDDE